MKLLVEYKLRQLQLHRNISKCTELLFREKSTFLLHKIFTIVLSGIRRSRDTYIHVEGDSPRVYEFRKCARANLMHFMHARIPFASSFAFVNINPRDRLAHLWLPSYSVNTYCGRSFSPVKAVHRIAREESDRERADRERGWNGGSGGRE